jgi:hypothetical protein
MHLGVCCCNRSVYVLIPHGSSFGGNKQFTCNGYGSGELNLRTCHAIMHVCGCYSGGPISKNLLMNKFVLFQSAFMKA